MYYTGVVCAVRHDGNSQILVPNRTMERDCSWQVPVAASDRTEQFLTNLQHVVRCFFHPLSFFLLPPNAFLQLVVSDDLLSIICFIGLFSPVCCLC